MEREKITRSASYQGQVVVFVQSCDCVLAEHYDLAPAYTYFRYMPLSVLFCWVSLGALKKKKKKKKKKQLCVEHS